MEDKRSLMLDSMGKYRTQSLFLELGYNEEAVYTLKDQDHEHNGTIYPSLKRLYLQEEDPTEYQFASKHLLGWKHWQRMCENKIIRKHIDEWREELEVKLRSQAVLDVISQARAGTFQAAKWVADRGWTQRGAGRPTNADIEHEKKIQARISNEYGDDVVRMFQQKQG
jgi:hypothetical protein